MATSKRFMIPAIVSTILLLLLLVVGGLGWAFFHTLAERTQRPVPYYAISTSVVERVQAPPASMQETIELPDTNNVRKPDNTTASLLQAFDNILPPAACLNYQDSITGRPAWHNPVEIQATITPTSIRITMQSPHQDKEAAP